MFRLSFYAIAFATVLTGFSNVYAFDYDGPKTTAVRDRSNPNQLVLTVVLKGVNPTDKKNFGVTADESQIVQQAIANTLDICLSQTSTSCSETDVHVRWALPRRPVAQIDNDYLSKTQIANFDSNGTILTQDPSDMNLWEYSVKIIITDAVEIPVGTKVLLRLFPDKVSSNGNKDKTDLLVKLGSGVRDGVSVSNVLGTPKSLIVQFQTKTTVTYMDESTGAPSSVLGVLIPNPTDGSTYPTLVYSANPTPNPDQSTCSIDIADDAETCSISCSNSDPQTIDTGSLSADPYASAGLRAATTPKATDSTLGFANVSIEQSPNYAIILQYLPEGTTQTCVMGIPTEAGTLVQISSGQEPTAGDPSCFIATAAYGTALDPHIDVLRWFRDAYLIKTPWGKSLVGYYYEKSPPLARWIAKHEWAKTLTRGVLWAPVLLLESMRDHRSLTLSAFLIFCFFTLFKRRRATY